MRCFLFCFLLIFIEYGMGSNGTGIYSGSGESFQSKPVISCLSFLSLNAANTPEIFVSRFTILSWPNFFQYRLCTVLFTEITPVEHHFIFMVDVGQSINNVFFFPCGLLR